MAKGSIQHNDFAKHILLCLIPDLYSVRKMRLFTDDSYKMFAAVRKMKLFTDKLRWLTVINGNVQHKACGALQLANAVLTGLD